MKKPELLAMIQALAARLAKVEAEFDLLKAKHDAQKPYGPLPSIYDQWRKDIEAKRFGPVVPFVVGSGSLKGCDAPVQNTFAHAATVAKAG